MSGLAQDQVDKQISQMVAFIEQEAREKADEIAVKAEEEFNIEKGRLVQQEKLKIMQMFERKEKQADTAKKIAYSTQLNVARLEVLKAQHDHLKTVVDNASSQLTKVVGDKAKYKTMLQGLVSQGLCALLEPTVSLSCMPRDKDLVKEVISAAVKTYKAESGLDCSCSVDTSSPLPDTALGGVVLKAARGRLVVENTLEKRLEMSVEQLMPAVRSKLFGPSPGRTFFD